MDTVQEKREHWKNRYEVVVKLDEFLQYRHKFKGVDFLLFREDMDGDEADMLLKIAGFSRSDYADPDWRYLVSQAEQTFNDQQVEAIREHFSGFPDMTVEVYPAHLPAHGRIGFSAIAVGGFDDVLMFHCDSSYSLPFKVAGYYNLHHTPCQCHGVRWHTSLMSISADGASRLNVGENAEGEEVRETADLWA